MNSLQKMIFIQTKFTFLIELLNFPGIITISGDPRVRIITALPSLWYHKQRLWRSYRIRNIRNIILISIVCSSLKILVCIS